MGWMKTTRQQIIDHLTSRRLSSAQEISRALRMTPANARHHLAILQDEGVVEPAGLQAVAGRGRPSRLFRLVQPAHRHSLDSLASALLQELAERLPPEEQEPCLQSLARRLCKKPPLRSSGEQVQSRRLPQALFEAVQRLNELNYAARWEARPQAPRLILGRCPFAAILDSHPELCRMDAFLLEELAGARVEQTARLAPDGQGGRQCVFLIHEQG